NLGDPVASDLIKGRPEPSGHASDVERLPYGFGQHRNRRRSDRHAIARPEQCLRLVEQAWDQRPLTHRQLPKPATGDLEKRGGFIAGPPALGRNVAHRFVPREEARDGGPDEPGVVGLADRLPSQVREEVAHVTGRVGPAQAVQVDDDRLVSYYPQLTRRESP